MSWTLGSGDGLEVVGVCTTGATEQAASMPTIAAIKKPTRNGRRDKKRGFCMGLILLEALLALCIFIVIVWWTMFSGRSKGGVGKTTTSASFATGLALKGFKTAVIDFDVGLRNLDLIMGCERRVVYDLINVIQGEANLNQALIKDKQCDNLFVLAASQTRDKDALSQEGVEKVLDDLRAMGFDYIVCDSPAGIETGALMAMHYADEALVVTNPEVSSVRDSDRILGMLGSKTKRAIEGLEPIKEHLLITRYNPARVEEGQMLSLQDIQDILRIKLLGVIPESETVLQASNQGTPAIHMNTSDVSEAYKDVIACVSLKRKRQVSSSACLEANKPCPFFPSSWVKRSRRRVLPKSACKSSWHTSAVAATPPSLIICPNCNVNCWL